MTAQSTAAALIEEAIAYEETERDAAPAEDRHFWDGWDREKIRQGAPVVRVITHAPGLGRVVQVTLMLVIELPDGGNVAVRDPEHRYILSGHMRRKGREGYCRDLARTLYGDLSVKYEALV